MEKIIKYLVRNFKELIIKIIKKIKKKMADERKLSSYNSIDSGSIAAGSTMFVALNGDTTPVNCKIPIENLVVDSLASSSSILPLSAGQGKILDTTKENIANKSNSTLLGDSPILYPTQHAAKAYADSKVTDVITSGATNLAPSQNAVFNALELKAPKANPVFTGDVTIDNGISAYKDVTIASTKSITLIGLDGGVTAETQPINDNSTKLATTAYADAKVATGLGSTSTTVAPSQKAVYDSLVLKAPTNNPTFTGTAVLPSTTSIGSVSSFELGHLDGVTSAIQTQLNAKISSITLLSIDIAPLSPSGGDTYYNSTTKELLNWNPNTSTWVEVGAYGVLCNYGGTDYIYTSLTNGLVRLRDFAPLVSPAFTGTPSLPTGTTGITQTSTDSSTKIATTAFVQAQKENPTFTGTIKTPALAIGAAGSEVTLTPTATELNYVDGVTSSIQSQLNSKKNSLISIVPEDNATISEHESIIYVTTNGILVSIDVLLSPPIAGDKIIIKNGNIAGCTIKGPGLTIDGVDRDTDSGTPLALNTAYNSITIMYVSNSIKWITI